MDPEDLCIFESETFARERPEDLHSSHLSFAHNLVSTSFVRSRLPHNYSVSLTTQWISNSDRAKGIWLYPLRTVWSTEFLSLQLGTLPPFVKELTSLFIILIEKLIFLCVLER